MNIKLLLSKLLCIVTLLLIATPGVANTLTLTADLTITDVSELSTYSKVDLNGFHLNIDIVGDLGKKIEITGLTASDTVNQKVTIGADAEVELGFVDGNYPLGIHVYGEVLTSSIKFKDVNSHVNIYVAKDAILNNTGITEIFLPNVVIAGTFNNDGNFTTLAGNSIDLEIQDTGTLYIKGTTYFGQNSDITILGTLKIDEQLRIHKFSKIDFGSDCAQGILDVIDVILDVHNDPDVFEVLGCGTVNLGDCSEVGTSGVNAGRFCGDLPVELVYFKGYKDNANHVLIWETATEHNASHFEIQGSNNRTDWSTLGAVEAYGNSQVSIEYEYIQKSVTYTYYRLIQYDFDGQFEVFGSISIEKDVNNFNTRVYPNIAYTHDQFKLEVSGINSEIVVHVGLFDQKGNLVWKKNINVEAGDHNIVSTFRLDKSLIAGTYFLVSNNGTKKDMKRIVIK
ncbi:T9SS type A sorting domain-containing protein [Flammeovirga pacifica]|uniref:Secretion system C-terminal sorting domain-containing protein n=1 Tax=Flammeovirga pacifica TaxID=915059 RepID=A0A1S1YSV0_FLAPC|nr:T9SS type A sorting domain-containing protein [Flammeovirga pacifica]OHX63943.1 hypothetical protein NH26_20245 [Flammeovirga pacifica]